MACPVSGTAVLSWHSSGLRHTAVPQTLAVTGATGVLIVSYIVPVSFLRFPPNFLLPSSISDPSFPRPCCASFSFPSTSSWAIFFGRFPDLAPFRDGRVRLCRADREPLRAVLRVGAVSAAGHGGGPLLGRAPAQLHDDSAVGFVGRPPPGARKCAPNVETMKISSRDTLFWDEHLPNAVGDSAAGFVGRPPPGARKCAPNFEILPTMSAEHAMPDEQDPVLGDSPICLFGDW